MHDIADLFVGLRREHFDFWMVAQFGRDILEEVRDGYAELLGPLVLIGRRPRTTGKLDFLQSHFGFAQIARQFTARTPEIDLMSSRGRLSSTHSSGVLETRPPSQ